MCSRVQAALCEAQSTLEKRAVALGVSAADMQIVCTAGTASWTGSFSYNAGIDVNAGAGADAVVFFVPSSYSSSDPAS